MSDIKTTTDYFLGLDMGTTSIGWAVTDLKYNVVKKHGKALWGVRLFEPANPAEERRVFRASRRRLQRKKQRIQFIQEIFAEEIMKKDPGFFLRMKESKYQPEDKKDLSGNLPELPYTLFTDNDYTDVEFHDEFPTIYHLRKAIIENKDREYDVRLIYLAVHHIIKNRGHFLFEGRKIEEVREFSTVFDILLEQIDDILNIQFAFDADTKIEIASALKDRNKTITSKKSELNKLFNAETKAEKAVVAMLAGATVKLADIFDDEDLKDADRSKLSFSDSTYDDYSGEIESILQERYSFIIAAKSVYDWALLAEMLGGYAYISQAKVAIYEKHAEDLRKLKKLLYADKAMYKAMFGVPEGKNANYSAYIGMTKKNGRKVVIEKNAGQTEFYDFVKKIISSLKSTVAEEILSDIEHGTFMPKQVIKDNGVIPYQVHEIELRAILANASAYLPFIKETDSEGFRMDEKVISIMKYRIPYYVGPVNTYHKEKGGNSWAVRKTDGKIYPWNFEEKIDTMSSAEEFIRRMTNKCTYLIGEDVVPKDSLIYSKFMVLNELNNLRINGEKITVDLKQKIYHELFEKKRKITGKNLRLYLKKEGIISDTDEISGIDGDFKSSLKAYLDFNEIDSNGKLSNKDKERIVLDISLFGEAGKLLYKRIRDSDPQLSDAQVKRICKLSYSGWGNLSYKFLTGIESPNPETGEVLSIINAMWETNDNLMQLLSRKYGYAQEIQDLNADKLPGSNITYDTVKDLYVSPSVKRPIWQTVQIVREIEKIMGKPPKRIFVEMAREKQTDGKRTNSRKKKLTEAYAFCKKEEKELYDKLANINDSEFRRDKLYLYFTQKGRCMYSGERIDFAELYNNNLYDIDHIYPQSKVMDDSLENRVLVKKSLNEQKSDKYPIKQDIRQKMTGFWTMLKEQNLISSEKYKRLTRASEFEEGELAGFIARQLVETRQSTKAVAELLQQMYAEKSEIVYAKASSVSEFRHTFDFIKVRDVNDYHHAKDAYLNIVVGNAYFVKFTKDAAWFVRNNPGRTYNLKKMFQQEDIERNREIAWKTGSDGTIVTVRKYMNKNNILFTRQSFEVKGGLFDQQIMKKGKGQVPIKQDDRLIDTEKYGAYNKAAGAYFMLVESDGKKGLRERSIEFVPVYLAAQFENNEMLKTEYCENILNLKKPKILISKIKINTLFCIDGFRMHLSGRTGKQLLFKNANQLVLSEHNNKLVKKINKFITRQKLDRNLKIISSDEVNNDELISLYKEFQQKLEKSVYGRRLATQISTLEDGKIKFEKLSIENKIVALSEILHLFQCNSIAGNLKLIGGPGHAGILVLNNNISKVENMQFIYSSITGFYENRLNLNEI